MLNVRVEQPADVAAIRSVLEAAFPTSVEADLVEALRAAGRLRLSLVAEVRGAVVGYIAFSPVEVQGVPHAKGIGLAPVAVLPAHQGQGGGSRLILAGLAECAPAGFGFVVVLGNPAYYGRFGFSPASRWGLGNEYGAGDEFMVLELRPRTIPAGGGLVRYAPEFAAVSAEPPPRATRPGK